MALRPIGSVLTIGGKKKIVIGYRNCPACKNKEEARRNCASCKGEGKVEKVDDYRK